MSDDLSTSIYTIEQLDYLRDTWSDNIMGKSKWDFKDCFWVNNGLYTSIEKHVKMCCLNTEKAEPFGNLFENSIDEIRLMDDYQNVKKGCNTNNPTSHCKNCSYKELTPILTHVGGIMKKHLKNIVRKFDTEDKSKYDYVLNQSERIKELEFLIGIDLNKV